MSKFNPKINLILASLILSFSVFFYCFNLSFAEVYTSSNFMLLDPVLTGGGGHSSSTDYGLDISIGQLGVGISSTTNFSLNS